MVGISITAKRAEKASKPVVHDRRSKDLLHNAVVIADQIEDPFEPDAKIIVFRSTRADPLGNMKARRQIDEAQYEGGRAFQNDWERAEQGPRAIDPSKEAVDGGRIPEPVNVGQNEALRRIGAAMKRLGAEGASIVSDVLISGLSIESLCKRRELIGRKWSDYYGLRLRECLTTLAITYGFAMERGRAPKGPAKGDRYAIMARKAGA